LVDTCVGWGGVGAGAFLELARPGKKNIKGEKAGVALKPPQPVHTNSTNPSIANDLSIEPTFTKATI
jgi:hypothetical protein